MNAPLLPPELLVASRTRWDAAIEALLAVLLAFMPWAFGAVNAWSELGALALAGVLVLIVLARAAVDRTFSLVGTWTYAPLVLFLALASLQLAPLPRGLVAALSPAAVDAPAKLLGADVAAERPATLSMYPLATAHCLRLIMLGAAVFFVVVNSFRTPPQIRRLLGIVFVIGCVEAALALLQIFTRAEQMYWSLDVGPARLTSGSFLNYSNFSQFMNLSIGAGVALLLVRLLDDRVLTGGRDDAMQAFGGARLRDHGVLLAGLVLCGVAVFASLSRNGVMSLAIATLVVGAALYARGALRDRGWVLAILPLGAFLALLTFGFDAIYERFTTLRESDQLASRWEMTLGTLSAWRDFPVWGSGLGTHEVVFPLYDPSVSSVLAQHADNDYAQLLEEAGMIGAVCVVAFAAMIAWLTVRICRRGRTAISAAAFGLALGLIAVAIHSVSDFGQRIPAVFSLTAVTCGLIVSLARLQRMPAPMLASSPRIGLQRAIAATLAIVVAGAWTWAIAATFRAARAEQWWAAALDVEDSIARAPENATDGDYADLLAAAGEAAANEPANVEYAYWLNVYRWRSMARQVDAATGQSLLSPAAQPLVARVADELAAVRRLCPTYGPPYALEGQLRLFVLGEPTGAELIRQGVRLASYDPPTVFTAAELAAHEGRTDEAASLLRRAVAMSPAYFNSAAELALNSLDRPELARELAGAEHSRLDYVAALAAASEKHADLADALRGEAEAALRKSVAGADARPYDLAALAALDASRGDHAAAADLFRRALLKDYDQFWWRLARVKSLVALGDDKQALREARICLALRPNNAVAQQLADEITVRLAE
jgi:O-antigen ligase